MTWHQYWRWRSTEPTICSSMLVVASAPEMPRPEPKTGPEGVSVRLPFIQGDNRRFVLRREVVPYLKQEGSLWSCELDDLHLMGYGYSREQAIQRFMNDFAVAYDGLVGKADDCLTADARQLRDALTALVAQITPVEQRVDVDLRQRASSFSSMCSCATR